MSILGFKAREEIASSLPVPNIFWKPQIYLYTLFFSSMISPAGETLKKKNAVLYSMCWLHPR
jgi:hypothetical protein